MAEIYESIYDTAQYINAIGGAEYLERTVNRSSTIYQQYLNRRQRRKSRNEFYGADSSSFLPSNIAADLRDSMNVNGVLSSIQQTKFEAIKNTSHTNGKAFYDSAQQFESYYDYLQRQNQTYQLTYNNTQMAQQIHQYQATSNSNHIQSMMRKMSPKPTQYKGMPLKPWQNYYPF